MVLKSGIKFMRDLIVEYNILLIMNQNSSEGKQDQKV